MPAGNALGTLPNVPPPIWHGNPLRYVGVWYSGGYVGVCGCLRGCLVFLSKDLARLSPEASESL